MNCRNAAVSALAGLVCAGLLLGCSGGKSSSGPGWGSGSGGGGGGGLGGNKGKLTLNVQQGGSVTTNPDIGSCTGPAICDMVADRGLVVTLTAAPEAGWVFEEWELCEGPSGLQCVTTIVESKVIIAEFDRAP